MGTSGDLQEILQTISQRAVEYGLYVVEVPIRFYGKPHHTELVWPKGWQEYIELARMVEARILYLEAKRFDLEQEAVDQILGKIGDGRGYKWRDAEKANWLAERLVEEMQDWRQYNGQVHQLVGLWIKEGVAHYLDLVTNWHSEYTEAAEQALNEADSVEEENMRVRSKEESQSRLQQAKQLAAHERFPEATSEAKRHYMAQQLFSDLDSFDVKEIATLAQVVYWWEVEPGVRSTKAQKARDLRASGESLKNIAAVLDMPEAKVKAALDAREL